MYRASPPCGNHYAKTEEFARRVKRLGMRTRMKMTDTVHEEKLIKNDLLEKQLVESGI